MDTVLHVERNPFVEEEPSVAERIATKLSPRAFTYGDLRAYYINIGRPTPGAEPLSQSDKNRLSVLNQWQKVLGKTDESAVDGDLDPDVDFTQLAEAFDAHLEKTGNSSRDRANKKSMLAKWSSDWGEFLAHAGAPKFEQYHEALRYYLERYEAINGRVVLTRLSVQIGAQKNYLGSTLQSKCKKIAAVKSLPAVKKLEHLLGAPKGALTRFCRWRPEEKKISEVIASKRFKSEHASTVTKRVHKAGPYRLSVWPAPLLKEWHGYMRHKTERFPALLRRSMWRTQDLPGKNMSGRRTRFGVLGKKYCISAHAVADRLSSLFGFARSFYEIEDNPGSLSFSHLANIEFLKAYVDFMESRVGRVTRTTTQALGAVASLTHPKWGYLTQQPEAFAEKHPEGIAQEEWSQFCGKTYEELISILRRLREAGAERPSRDPESGIKPILERRRPITYLLEMADRVALYIERESFWFDVERELNLERFLLMLRMMIYQPLRIKMFSIMEFGKGTKNTLYKRSDGCWAIRFKPEDFKNEKGAAQKRYDVAFPERMTRHIERYLYEVRPRFLGAHSPYVFPSYTTKYSRMMPSELATSFTHNTAMFVDEGECMFGPHAIRHIVATDYIKNNPNGFQVAADVLHDKLETVIKAYAHLKAEDGHRHYQKYLETVIAEREAA